MEQSNVVACCGGEVAESIGARRLNALERKGNDPLGPLYLLELNDDVEGHMIR